MDNLTFPQLIPISRVSGLGVVPGRRWASVYRGLSLFWGNTFRSQTFDRMVS
jgi:hypothetical protein